ncbi:MAG: ABC transporter substrate-binding protein [Fibrobacterota bacterium]
MRLLIVLIFLSLAQVLFFSGCGHGGKYTVMVKMMPEQEKFFRENVISGFEEEYGCDIKVEGYETLEDVEERLGSDTSLLLLKVPFENTIRFASNGDLLPLDKLLGQEEMEKFKDTYFLLDLTKTDGSYFYIPRKFETRMLVYRKSKVREAVKGWERYSRDINLSLKKHNGYGLPSGFVLEEDPGEWDYFDIYAAAFYWSRENIDGEKKGRLAHRAKKYSGTSQRIVDRCYQLGASPMDIVNMNGDAVMDAFLWEAVYTSDSLYSPSMIRERWSGSGIWKGFASGSVFMSFLTQIDCFFLHGTYSPDMPGYLGENRDDMGVSVMPAGVSMALDADGNPVRRGNKGITTGGWWWGIPANTAAPKLGYKLAEYITNTDNQIAGCSNFGMVPVRRDILGDIGLMFGRGWVSDVFNTAFLQLKENRYNTIPRIEHYSRVSDIYIEAWYDICVNGNRGPGGRVSAPYIKNLIKSVYQPKLGSGFHTLTKER